jgi:HEAT repeat protein/Na+/melibiose symporter-like transporter
MSTSIVTNAEKLRGLPWQAAMGATNVVFCYLTVFGSLFLLFLGEMGMPKGKIGFLTALFPFCGVVAVFVAPVVERWGFKRSFILFFGARKVVVGALLAAPWFLTAHGPEAAFYYVAAVLALFAVCRAVAETAWYPWAQEMVPDFVRGKFSAVSTIATTIAGAITIAAVAYVIARASGPQSYIAPMAVGVLFGLASALCCLWIPGGAPVQRPDAFRSHWAGMRETLRDRKFVQFMIGLSAVSLGFAIAASFIPLYMKERIGLTPGWVIFLENGALFGTLLSSYLWGWAADRYGSKPVMLTGLALLVVLPIGWWLLPRGQTVSAGAAMAMSALAGAALSGWGIGWTRLLFVSIVPAQKKTAYLAVFYAWIGVVSGLGPLLAGQLLDRFKGLDGKFWVLPLDPYAPLFALGFLILLAGLFILGRLKAERGMGPARFVRMFLQGDPVLALESMVRFNTARSEADRMSHAQRLGQARSPLTVQELVEALDDPSFNVRYEAVTSIARTRQDRRLVDALARVLRGPNPELAEAAAWALGRQGHRSAIRPLREMLLKGSPGVQACSARALGMLGDQDAGPDLILLFHREKDVALRLACAAALGGLRARAVTPALLAWLRDLDDESCRRELSFALAQIVGRDYYFIRLWRETHVETGTLLSGALSELKERLPGLPGGLVHATLDLCIETLARDDLPAAAPLLAQVLRALPFDRIEPAPAAVLNECAERLAAPQTPRIEHFLLALHTLNAVYGED